MARKVRKGRGTPSQWEDRHRWMLSLLRTFVDNNGWEPVSNSLVVPPGAKLGTWIAHRRASYRRDELPGWLEAELESIPGWEWDPIRASHQRHLDAVLDYLEEHDLSELGRATEFSGLRIGKWISERRTAHARGKHTWVSAELEAIPGWTWAPRQDLVEARLELANEYLSALSATQLLALGRWIRHRRKAYRAGRLDQTKTAECEAIPGWTWEPNPVSPPS